MSDSNHVSVGLCSPSSPNTAAQLPYRNAIFFFSTSGIACMSVSIADARGNTSQVKPEQREIGFLSQEIKYNMEEITKVVNAESSDALPGRVYKKDKCEQSCSRILRCRTSKKLRLINKGATS